MGLLDFWEIMNLLTHVFWIPPMVLAIQQRRVFYFFLILYSFAFSLDYHFCEGDVSLCFWSYNVHARLDVFWSTGLFLVGTMWLIAFDSLWLEAAIFVVVYTTQGIVLLVAGHIEWVQYMVAASSLFVLLAYWITLWIWAGMENDPVIRARKWGHFLGLYYWPYFVVGMCILLFGITMFRAHSASPSHYVQFHVVWHVGIMVGLFTVICSVRTNKGAVDYVHNCENNIRQAHSSRTGTGIGIRSRTKKWRK